MNTIKIGTRGSPLALVQARETRDRLMAAHGLGAEAFEIIAITTTGDRIRDRPLAAIGGKGLFTKEIEEALFAGSIDLAVHSMKDMPAVVPQGLGFAAVLPREDARDAFISLNFGSLQELPNGAKLGSSSVRRNAQALRMRPDLVSAAFRGNVGTRLQKLADGIADATFLAVAGLNRLGLAQHITRVMEMDEMLPAVAQGAVGIEIHEGNFRARQMLEAVNHQPTDIAVQCERAFLATLEGSCQTPIAGHAVVKGNMITFRGQALTLDGAHVFEHDMQGTTDDAVMLGREVGQRVKELGGDLLLLA